MRIWSSKERNKNCAFLLIFYHLWLEFITKITIPERLGKVWGFFFPPPCSLNLYLEISTSLCVKYHSYGDAGMRGENVMGRPD